MYENYFGLKEAPFSIAPNPHYLYMSRQHNEALAHLIYGVEREGGFILLTGEVGTGKTTVCRCFFEQIPENTDVAFILNPKLDSEQLLATICDELGIGYIADNLSIKDYTDYINERLLRSHSEGRHTVLIIDEAQNLSPLVLEQLRLLTNLETHEKKLLQIILLGQPELQELFVKPELRQLSQRVTARFHLNALSKEEIAPYVNHRLSVAGCVMPEIVFPEKTIQKLYAISKGVPRIINLVCDRSLLGAYTENKKSVDPKMLQIAANEVLGKNIVLHHDVTRAFQRYNLSENLRKNKFPLSAISFCLLGLLFGLIFSGLFSTQAPSSVVVKTDTAISKSIEAPKDTVEPSQGTDIPPQSIFSTQISDVSPVEGVSVRPSSTHLENEQNYLTFNQVLASGGAFAEADAYVDILRVWGMEYSPADHGKACNYAKNNGLRCLNKFGSFGVVSHLGLPVILTLFDDKGEKRYMILRQIASNHIVIMSSGNRYKIPLTELQRRWRGHFVVLWKAPEQYSTPLQPGTIAPITRWLGQQLDIVEGKPNPELGRSLYDENLVSRVKAFQKNVGEQADGIAGVNTLILLTKRTGKNIPSLMQNGEAM